MNPLLKLIKLALAVMLAVVGLMAQTGGNGTITGAAEREDGKPLPGVTVTATNQGNHETKEATTGADGRFTLSLGSGNYSIVFTASGYATVSLQKPITVTASKTSETKAVRMSKQIQISKIRGTVYNEDSMPMGGATVTVERTDEGKKLKMSKQANAEGQFAFTLPGEPGHYRIIASLKGFKPDSKDIDVDAGEMRSVAMKLSK